MSKEDQKVSLDRFFASLDPEGGEAEDMQTNVENRLFVPEGERPCPICKTKMVPDKSQGIQVDVCHEHGIWLDRGELAAVLGRAKEQAVCDAMANAGDSGQKEGFLLGYTLGKSLGSR